MPIGFGLAFGPLYPVFATQKAMLIWATFSK
jgi:hypothetical protein